MEYNKRLDDFDNGYIKVHTAKVLAGLGHAFTTLLIPQEGRGKQADFFIY